MDYDTWTVILDTLRQRLASIAFDRGGLVVGAAFVVYAWIAPAYVVDGETAHFVTLGVAGGAAHPSGYPLYVLWLHAMRWLPGSAAHAAALATVVLAVAQLAVLHAACRAWGARSLAASIAVAIFAGAPVVLGIYTIAEVFALNGLVVAFVLWIAAAGGPLRGWQRCAVLGLVAGLGLANHLTCALVAPIGVLGIVRGAREARSLPAALALAAAGVVVGLAPYLYLVAAPEHAGSWGHITGLGDIATMILRSEYGGPAAFQPGGVPISAATSLGALVATVGRTWLWLPALAGIAMLGVRIARSSTGEPRVGWAMLAASIVLAGPLLVVRFNVAPEDIGRYVVERFHVLPALLLAPAVAIACDRALAWRRLAALGAPLGEAIATLGFAAVAGMALPHVLRVHSPAVEQEVRNVLAALPADAVVIGDTDDLVAGIPYAQLVLGERTDVTYVQWSLMKLAWYRDRVAARGVVADLGAGGVSSVQVTADLLARGRPVFAQLTRVKLLESFPHYPVGTLMRVLPANTAPPAVADVFAENKRVFAAYRIDYALPGEHDGWATEVHRRYAFTWDLLARELAASNRPDDAAWAFEAAREIGPQP